jgi:hypothetical protein
MVRCTGHVSWAIIQWRGRVSGTGLNLRPSGLLKSAPVIGRPLL